MCDEIEAFKRTASGFAEIGAAAISHIRQETA